MNPSKKADRAQLSKAQEHWYRQFDSAREMCQKQVADYAGSRYSKEMGFGRSPKTLLNLLQLLTVSLTVALCYNRPRVKVISDTPGGNGFAKHQQHNLNKY